MNNGFCWWFTGFLQVLYRVLQSFTGFQGLRVLNRAWGWDLEGCQARGLRPRASIVSGGRGVRSRRNKKGSPESAISLN